MGKMHNRAHEDRCITILTSAYNRGITAYLRKNNTDNKNQQWEKRCLHDCTAKIIEWWWYVSANFAKFLVLFSCSLCFGISTGPGVTKLHLQTQWHKTCNKPFVIKHIYMAFTNDELQQPNKRIF